MFDKEFYPTPKNVVYQMISQSDIAGKIVLEPSAGKGDIVDVLKESGCKTLACELNKELAIIVSAKCDQFLGHDFLELKSEQISHCHFIIMNPPFKNADEHIIHAYEIAPEGCEIISLVNYETINNAFTRRRSVLTKLISDFGSSENIGDVFSDAERTTGIDIGLVKLHKPKSGADEFDDFLFSDEEEAEHFGGDGVIKYSRIRDIVGRYVQGVRMYNSVMNSSDSINEIIKPLGGKFNIKFNALDFRGGDYTKMTRDTFKKELQKSAWVSIFNEMKMDKYITKSVKETLNKFIEQQSTKPFTMKNIFAMINLIVGTHEGRMDKVIEETFDWLTRHHDENKHSVEGWKTNSMYMVNEKFIAPYCGVGIGYSGQPEIQYGSRGSESFDDLIKALCVITGQRYETKVSLYDFFRGEEIGKDDHNRNIYAYKEFGRWYEWNYFTIKVFKKGTLHAKFNSKKVWEDFNKAAVKAKGWQLPTRTGSDARRSNTGVEIFK